jgi:hypothetical protein
MFKCGFRLFGRLWFVRNGRKQFEFRQFNYVTVRLVPEKTENVRASLYQTV